MTIPNFSTVLQDLCSTSVRNDCGNFYTERFKLSTQKAIKLAARLNIPLEERDSMEGFMWDGKSLSLSCGDKNTSVDNLFHDIAHYLVATPERRHIPNFGLGNSPDCGGELLPLLDKEARQAEEERASILGILLQRQAKLPYKYILIYHSWHEYPNQDIEKVLLELYSQGLITEEGHLAI